MAKGIREKIRLVSSAGTGHFYTTDKNKRNSTARAKSWSHNRRCASRHWSSCKASVISQTIDHEYEISHSQS